MSVTNIISNVEITLVQGVNGLFFCEESWIAKSRRNTCCKELLDKGSIIAKNENIDTECLQTDL